MPGRKSVEIDLETAHRLKAQGVPTAEIARQLKLPVSTLKDHLKRALPAKPTDVYNGSPTEVHKRGGHSYPRSWIIGAFQGRSGGTPCVRKQFQWLAGTRDKVIDADREIADPLFVAGHIQKPKRFDIDVPGGVDRQVKLAADMPPGKIGIDRSDMDALCGIFLSPKPPPGFLAEFHEKFCELSLVVGLLAKRIHIPKAFAFKINRVNLIPSQAQIPDSIGFSGRQRSLVG